MSDDVAAETLRELPMLLNHDALRWERTISEAGERSPEYALLSEDKATGLTLLMFRVPVAVHIKRHRHARAETHVVLAGGTHVFAAGGRRYAIERGGTLRMPGGTVHEAWLPAASQTLNVLESGWVVDWIAGGPSIEDIGVEAP